MIFFFKDVSSIYSEITVCVSVCVCACTQYKNCIVIKIICEIFFFIILLSKSQHHYEFDPRFVRLKHLYNSKIVKNQFQSEM